MTNLLVIKEQLKEFYAKYSGYLAPLIKFVLAFTVLFIINNRLGFHARLSDITVAVILAAISAILPYGAITIVAGGVAVGQIFAVSPIMAAVILVVYIIMYCLAIRYTSKFANAILAIPILYVLNIPYTVPILLGMIATPVTVLPTACGVVIYYMFSAIKKTAGAATGTSMEDILSLYKLIVDNALANHEMVFYIVLFTIALLITYFIRKRDLDYAFEAANAAGTIVCILGVLIGKLGFDVSGNTLVLLLGSILSGIIVYVICYFRMTLDYTAAEHLQFEDDDYYYYVKAVPKIKITAPEKNVKRINPQKASGNTQNLQAVQDTLKETGKENVRKRAYELDLEEEIEIDTSKFDL